jgi:hypothetical protein
VPQSSNLLGRCALILVASPVVLLAILWPWHPHSPLGWALVSCAGLPPLVRFAFFTRRAETLQNHRVELDPVGPEAGSSLVRIGYGLALALASLALLALAIHWLEGTAWIDWLAAL